MQEIFDVYLLINVWLEGVFFGSIHIWLDPYTLSGFNQSWTKGKKNQQGDPVRASQGAWCDIPRPQDTCLWWKQEPVHRRRAAIQINGVCCQVGAPRNVSTTPVSYVQYTLLWLAAAYWWNSHPVILIAEIQWVQGDNPICGTAKPVPSSAIPQGSAKGCAIWHNSSSGCCPERVAFSQVGYQCHFFTVSFLQYPFLLSC